MTTAHTVGAVSHNTLNWPAINWPKVHRTVRRLQARIVQATQAGRWNKVKALQHLLTHSFSGKALAVKRVTDNQGKRTAGVDGVTWTSPQDKTQAVHALRRRGYRARPLRRVSIPKSNGKRRLLGIPTMQDRAMQALYLLALEPIAETTGDPNSYGFRRERSTADAIEQCFNVLRRRHFAAWVLEGDIKACFDRISHTWLLDNIPVDRAILQQWLTAGVVDRHVFTPSEQGTPQGGIISPVLANLCLDGLEALLREAFPKTKQGMSPMVNLVRYADDFIITGRSQALLETEVKPLVEQFLHERGLELSPEKTRITRLEDGFDFLGQTVRKYNGKLLITPSKQNVTTFLRHVRDIIQANKQATAGHLVLKLNPLIRGWAQYHQHVVSKATFGAIDHALVQVLWRWAKRRHPQKGAHWVQRRYFERSGGRKWVFRGEVDGQEKRLFIASSLPIVRHTKVRGAANPFAPEWEPYFERRLGVKMSKHLQGRRGVLRLWKEQNGKCPICEQPITEVTGWENHHIMWRSVGGADQAENRVLLHPECHTKVHQLRLTIEKPRPAVGRL
jgi:RNA-directed DNA polymerase